MSSNSRIVGSLKSVAAKGAAVGVAAMMLMPVSANAAELVKGGAVADGQCSPQLNAFCGVLPGAATDPSSVQVGTPMGQPWVTTATWRENAPSSAAALNQEIANNLDKAIADGGKSGNNVYYPYRTESSDGQITGIDFQAHSGFWKTNYFYSIDTSAYTTSHPSVVIRYRESTDPSMAPLPAPDARQVAFPSSEDNYTKKYELTAFYDGSDAPTSGADFQRAVYDNVQSIIDDHGTVGWGYYGLSESGSTVTYKTNGDGIYCTDKVDSSAYPTVNIHEQCSLA